MPLPSGRIGRSWLLFSAFPLFVGFPLFLSEAAAAPLSGAIYVRTTGSDATGDGSAGNPFATIQKAVNKAVANGVDGPLTIDVGEGLFAEQVTVVSIPGASAANPIAILGVAEFTVVDGGGVRDHGFKLDGADFVRIEGVEIRNTKKDGVLITRSAAGDPALNDTVFHCSIHDVGIGTTKSCVEIGSGCHDAAVERCRLDADTFGIRVNGSSSDHVSGVRIVNNFIWSAGDREIFLDFCDGAFVAHNSVSGQVHSKDGGSLAPNQFLGNIFANFKTGSDAWSFRASGNDVFPESDFNLYFTGNPDGKPIKWKDQARRSLSEWQATSAKDGMSLSGNPAFQNEPAGDLHLAVTSPAIEQGQSGLVADDVDGDARDPMAPDIGADEVTAPIPRTFDIVLQKIGPAGPPDLPRAIPAGIRVLEGDEIRLSVPFYPSTVYTWSVTPDIGIAPPVGQGVTEWCFNAPVGGSFTFGVTLSAASSGSASRTQEILGIDRVTATGSGSTTVGGQSTGHYLCFGQPATVAVETLPAASGTDDVFLRVTREDTGALVFPIEETRSKTYNPDTLGVFFNHRFFLDNNEDGDFDLGIDTSKRVTILPVENGHLNVSPSAGTSVIPVGATETFLVDELFECNSEGSLVPVDPSGKTFVYKRISGGNASPFVEKRISGTFVPVETGEENEVVAESVKVLGGDVERITVQATHAFGTKTVSSTDKWLEHGETIVFETIIVSCGSECIINLPDPICVGRETKVSAEISVPAGAAVGAMGSWSLAPNSKAGEFRDWKDANGDGTNDLTLQQNPFVPNPIQDAVEKQAPAGGKDRYLSEIAFRATEPGAISLNFAHDISGKTRTTGPKNATAVQVTIEQIQVVHKDAPRSCFISVKPNTPMVVSVRRAAGTAGDAIIVGAAPPGTSTQAQKGVLFLEGKQVSAPAGQANMEITAAFASRPNVICDTAAFTVTDAFNAAFDPSKITFTLGNDNPSAKDGISIGPGVTGPGAPAQIVKQLFPVDFKPNVKIQTTLNAGDYEVGLSQHVLNSKTTMIYGNDVTITATAPFVPIRDAKSPRLPNDFDELFAEKSVIRQFVNNGDTVALNLTDIPSNLLPNNFKDFEGIDDPSFLADFGDAKFQTLDRQVTLQTSIVVRHKPSGAILTLRTFEWAISWTVGFTFAGEEVNTTIVSSAKVSIVTPIAARNPNIIRNIPVANDESVFVVSHP